MDEKKGSDSKRNQELDPVWNNLFTGRLRVVFPGGPVEVTGMGALKILFMRALNQHYGEGHHLTPGDYDIVNECPASDGVLVVEQKGDEKGVIKRPRVRVKIPTVAV